MSAPISEARKRAVMERAAAQLRGFNRPVVFELDITLTVGLIGTLQLAFRHPGNVGATREMLEQFVRDLIEQIDPSHGDVHAFLMMGFDEQHDE